MILVALCETVHAAVVVILISWLDAGGCSLGILLVGVQTRIFWPFILEM